MRRRAIIGKSKVPATPVYTGFVMQIETTSSNEVFTLPTQAGMAYNATVLWGDGTQSSVTGHNVNNVKTYATAGIYNIEIKGTFDSIYFNNAGSKLLVKKILSWGGDDFGGFATLGNSFYGCSNLNELATGEIKQKESTPIPVCSSVFRGCTSLIEIPVDIFRSLTNSSGFSSIFNGCTNLSSIPVDLFRYNINSTTFTSSFYGCTQLANIPDNLFGYNTLATNYSSTFSGCSKLKLQNDIFGSTPDFGTRVMNFTNCFSRTTFNGEQGTAPELWNATMDVSSTTTTCFGGAGNSTTSLTNYASIPVAWK